MRDWATTRRRRWSAARIGAALALHVLVLGALTLAIDRVERPRQTDRTTTLVTVTLRLAPPPSSHALPLPALAPPPTLPPALASRAPAREAEPQPITPPAPAVAEAAPASAPSPDLRFLDSAATRQAIRDAARGQTLASRGNAITSTEQTAGERLARNVDAAHKADCMKQGGALGLLALPVIIAEEAMGKCAHKL
jgi:hypothetical protein